MVKMFVHSPKAVKAGHPGDRLFFVVGTSDGGYDAFKCVLTPAGFTHPNWRNEKDWVVFPYTQDGLAQASHYGNNGAEPTAWFKKDSFYNEVKNVDELISIVKSRVAAHAVVTKTATVSPVYRLINKSNNRVDHFWDPSSLAAHMLGKRVSNFLVIKSDESGDRLVVFSSYEVQTIEKTLRCA